VRFMQRAIEFEIERQIELIESGGQVTQETRLWDERAGATRVMRSKEEAHDYRYFPEPDLQPLAVTADWVEQVRQTMPELPDARRKRFTEQYSLSFDDASLLTRDRALADFYERAAAASTTRGAANWLKGELLRELDAAGVSPEDSPVSPEELGALVRAVEDGRISGKQGKDVLVEMFRTGKGASQVIEEQGLAQLSDAAEIEKIVTDVLASNLEQLAAYRAGKEALFGFFVGQVMKASKGKANPKVAGELLRAKLKE
ncbi:MAG: Asp-tRNA(Asn)/Glu-tRNA(Gln) amidotransferase GatCAB subunit B, partial [Acidobacteriota bacterium]|nr:Asp-tRNA(Asn)/Glu-tRNA(Gln) amidotransferase GatCAB subunit B [Acidobacteriota bacterium]